MEMIRLLALILALAAFGDCHTYLSEIIINGARQGADKCIRPQATTNPPVYRNSPVSDKTVFPNGLLGANMTCGMLPFANRPANGGKCAIKAGDSIGLQYWHDTPNDDVIATSHYGPVIIYLAKSETGSGNVWFKIYQDGYNSATQAWATDRLISNRGVVTFTIPTGISPGNYLMRAEVIGLHEAFMQGGAQSYVYCAEFTIASTGTDNPTGVAFPGAYSKTDPGILFSVYQGNNAKYVIPGPALYMGSSSATPNPTPNPSSTTTTARSTTTTTGRGSTSTSARASTSTTTGRSTTTTTSSAATGSCTDRSMVCVGTSSYQTCDRGSWAAVQNCPTGRTCSPAGIYIYCL